MRRTELLQEVRKMRFEEDCVGGGGGGARMLGEVDPDNWTVR